MVTDAPAGFDPTRREFRPASADDAKAINSTDSANAKRPGRPRRRKTTKRRLTCAKPVERHRQQHDQENQQDDGESAHQGVDAKAAPDVKLPGRCKRLNNQRTGEDVCQLRVIVRMLRMDSSSRPRCWAAAGAASAPETPSRRAR